MSQTSSIHPELQDLFARPGTASGGGALPPEILQSVPQRLAFLALVLIVIEGVGLGINSATANTLRVTTIGIELLVGATVFVIARYRVLSTPRLLVLGLGYELFLATSFAISSPTSLWFGDPTRMWIPAIAIVILIYPIIVPNTTGKVLVTSLIAAAVEPVYVLIRVARGTLEMPAANMWIGQVFGLAVAVGLATVISRQLYQIGVKLSQARSAGSYQLISKLGEGRHGRGVARRASDARATRGGQAHPPRTPRRGRSVASNGVRPVRTRSSSHGDASVATHDRTVRLRCRERWNVLLRDGTPGRDGSGLVGTDHGPQPASRVTYLMLQACASLHEAHLAGIVHRDIKPANMFVCRYGGELDFVKVLDFGLVKHRDVRRKDDSAPDTGAVLAETAAQLTQVGRIAGTPAFMAPELAMGDEDLDGRIDIYALGCVAYWLLTQRLVFERFSTQEMLMAHVGQPPTPPSKQVAGIPAGLEEIILQCLAKEPDHRPADASTLAAALRGLGLAEAWTPELREEWWATNDLEERDSAAAEISKRTTMELEGR